MGVLTYLPMPQRDGFVLTLNRDEDVNRPIAIPPRQYFVNNEALYYPKDTVNNDTWIATNAHFTICLLNGDTQKHLTSSSNKNSQGQVILDFFEMGCLKKFIRHYDFIGIDPFVLIIIDNNNRTAIYQFCWNGQTKYLESLDGRQPRIWSSKMLLCTDEMIFEIERNFETFLLNIKADHFPKKILQFHHFRGQWNVVLGGQRKIRTASITQIVRSNVEYTISYEDLTNKKVYRYRIF